MTETVPHSGKFDPPPGAKPGANDMIEALGHPVGGGLIKDDYHPRLTNEDLAPLKIGRAPCRERVFAVV